MTIAQNTLKHPRTIIREKVHALISGACSIPTEKIFLSRPNEVWLSEIPCVLIYYTDDATGVKQKAPLNLAQTLSLSVQVLARFSSEEDVDAWLDSRALEIQYALLHTMFLGLEIVESVMLVNTVPTTLNSESETDVESIALNWEIRYIDNLEYAVEPMNEFLKFNDTFTNSEGVVVAEDNVTVRDK